MHSSSQRVYVAELRSNKSLLNLRGSVCSFLLMGHLPPPFKEMHLQSGDGLRWQIP